MDEYAKGDRIPASLIRILPEYNVIMSEPISFLLPMTVAETDIDQNGHANNIAYLRWVQDVAIAHWREAVPRDQANDIVWVVIRHEIDYRHPAFAGETLALRTWIGEAKGVRMERFTEIERVSDGQILSQARSIWCSLDKNTGKPRRLPETLRALFFRPEA